MVKVGVKVGVRIRHRMRARVCSSTVVAAMSQGMMDIPWRAEGHSQRQSDRKVDASLLQDAADNIMEALARMEMVHWQLSGGLARVGRFGPARRRSYHPNLCRSPEDFATIICIVPRCPRALLRMRALSRPRSEISFV